MKMKMTRLAIAGLVHGHVDWITSTYATYDDLEIAGFWDDDPRLRAAYGARYDIPERLLFDDLERMLTETAPAGVAIFTDIRDHLPVVRACARRGIPVMVEKPLAISPEDGREMARLAREAGIHLLTNYETTWYAANHYARRRVVEEAAVGPIRKMVVHSGHRGPKEVGCPPHFLAWLLDPARGGGALTDFGCYGANLMTWLMEGRRPRSVTAVTQRLKSDPVYDGVEDEATIILTYPEAQGIIQASWNWPVDRKDMEIYGERGFVHALDARTAREKVPGQAVAEVELSPLGLPLDNPFAYLAAVVRGEMAPGPLWSVENNLVVLEILDAARRSAAEQRSIHL